MDRSPQPPLVVVVGGGITGTGIARDLAMRGANVTLVERDRLAEGTTGRMHGLLHSGARYAISDPESARQCIRENEILRDIASHCIGDTGGLFVSLEGDDPDYFEEKVAACERLGIPTEEVTPEAARRLEPGLSDSVDRAFLVPDAAIDPFRLVAANAASAEEHGATIRTGTEVVDLVVDDGAVTGVVVTDSSGAHSTIDADHVVNAAGPWVADVLADYIEDVPLRPAKGAMAVTNSRPVNTVINRCRPTDEGDILVPHETTAILGTTDRTVDDPDDFPESREEIDLLVEEISEMVPTVEENRLIRSYWGVRPLYDPTHGSETGPDAATEDGATDGNRDFAVLDHASRDGLAGLTSVLGGKLTTYRLMAEETVDLLAGRLGLDAECRTANEPLPGSRESVDFREIMAVHDLKSPIASRSTDRLGDRTDEVLESSGWNPVVCECEAVTAAEVRNAIETVGPDLGAVRMRTRATMGTCQGGFCSHRLAVILAESRDVSTAWRELDSLVRERWKGQRLVLDGDHLSQAALTHTVRHLSLNVPDGIAPAEVPDLGAFDSGRSENVRSPSVSLEEEGGHST